MSIKIKNALMTGCAIAGVARYAERWGGVSLLPTKNQVRLADKRTRQADILNLGLIKILIDFLNGAQTTHQHDGHVNECRLHHDQCTMFVDGISQSPIPELRSPTRSLS